MKENNIEEASRSFSHLDRLAKIRGSRDQVSWAWSGGMVLGANALPGHPQLGSRAGWGELGAAPVPDTFV